MAYWHHFRDPSCTQSFAHAHAFVQISLTDGSFLELGIDLRAASGPDDVERSLEACETDEQFMACLHAYVKRDADATDERHPECRSLTDDETARANSLLGTVFDTPHDAV